METVYNYNDYQFLSFYIMPNICKYYANNNLTQKEKTNKKNTAIKELLKDVFKEKKI